MEPPLMKLTQLTRDSARLIVRRLTRTLATNTKGQRFEKRWPFRSGEAGRCRF
jgi:hypothetical protein